jgi:hypothetical protein
VAPPPITEELMASSWLTDSRNVGCHMIIARVHVGTGPANNSTWRTMHLFQELPQCCFLHTSHLVSTMEVANV